MTIFSAPVVLFVLLEISNFLSITSIYKKALLVFMSCTCTLTGVAHIVNITVTRRLINEGVNVPVYFRIGFCPSVEMAIDYLGWGFFTGLAFLCVGLSGKSNEQSKRIIKLNTLLCGILCLIGFWGTIFINENIWYIAPIGYGIGTMIICIQLFKYNEDK